MAHAARSILSRISAIDGIGLAVLSGLVLVFVFGLLGPSALRDQQLVARQQAAARQRLRVDGTLMLTRNLADEIKKTTVQIEASPLSVRPESALNERLASLVALSAECKFTVDDVKPGTAVHGGRFAAIPITMAGHGGYHDTVRFLHLLHDRFSDVGVAAFKLNGNPEQPGADCSGTLELQWLAQPQANPAQVVAVPLQ